MVYHLLHKLGSVFASFAYFEESYHLSRSGKIDNHNIDIFNTLLPSPGWFHAGLVGGGSLLLDCLSSGGPGFEVSAPLS